MNPGQIRRSQVVTTYGPGALVDFPKVSVIIAGIDERGGGRSGCASGVFGGQRSGARAIGAKGDDCDGPLRFRQIRGITVRTCLTGEPVPADTAYLTCHRCGTGYMDLKRAMRLDPDGFTPTLAKMSLRAAAMEPSESAADVLLGELAGVNVRKSKLHDLCGDVNDTAWSLLAEGELGSARPLRPGERLFVEIDGVMAQVDKAWHEIKIAVIFAEGDHGYVSKDRNAIQSRVIVATRGDRGELGGLILNAVGRWLPKDAAGGPIIAENVVVLSDGAQWIRNLVDAVLPAPLRPPGRKSTPRAATMAATPLRSVSPLARTPVCRRKRHTVVDHRPTGRPPEAESDGAPRRRRRPDQPGVEWHDRNTRRPEPGALPTPPVTRNRCVLGEAERCVPADLAVRSDLYSYASAP